MGPILNRLELSQMKRPFLKKETSAKVSISIPRSCLWFSATKWDSELFVAHYKVPVAYSQNNSARLIPASQCAAIKSYDNGASARTMTTQYLYPRELVTKETAPCLLFRDEQAANPAVYVRKVEYASAKQELFSVSVLSTEVVFNGRPVGSRGEPSRVSYTTLFEVTRLFFWEMRLAL